MPPQVLIIALFEQKRFPAYSHNDAIVTKMISKDLNSVLVKFRVFETSVKCYATTRVSWKHTALSRFFCPSRIII